VKKLILVIAVFVIMLSGVLAGCQESVSPSDVSHIPDPSSVDPSSSDHEDGEDEQNHGDRHLKIDTGRYQGQLDSNFIEVALSGVQDPTIFKVFKLSETLKDNFNGLELIEGDLIKISYIKDENSKDAIVSLEKIETEGDLMIDIGRYQGQADSNFIEVALSGVQDPTIFKVFKLSEALKESFSKLELVEGDMLKIIYVEGENSKDVIIDLEKLQMDRYLKIDTGRYQGQADSNFIEVALSGVQDPTVSKMFMLSEVLKDNFSKLDLSAGDMISISYLEDEIQRNVVVDLKKMQ